MRDHSGSNHFKRLMNGLGERIPMRAAGIVQGRSGFTLMELMVTIAIIAILAAIAIPNAIAWRNDSQFNSAVREVKAAIEGTRMAAIRTNLPADVFFDGSGTFGTQTRRIANVGGVPTATLSPLVTHQLPPGNTVVSNNGGQLTYDDRGMATNMTIWINNSNGLCRKIGINLVGTSRIQKCP